MASAPTTSTAGHKPVTTEHQQASPLKALWRIVTHIDRSKINAWQALRNTVGLIAPLIAGYALGMPRGGLAMASGALNVSYSDGSDPYRQRAKRMLASTVWCSIAVLLGGLTAHSNALAIVMATLWAFSAGMLVALGSTAADVGVISTVVLLVYSAQALTPYQALQAAGLALCGGLLQIALSVALWPVRRYEPERRALATLYFELARVATLPVEATSAPLATREIAQAHEALSGLATDMSLGALRVPFFAIASRAHPLESFDAGAAAVSVGSRKCVSSRNCDARSIPCPCGKFVRHNRQHLLSGKRIHLEADRLVLGIALGAQLGGRNRTHLRILQMPPCAT